MRNIQILTEILEKAFCLSLGTLLPLNTFVENEANIKEELGFDQEECNKIKNFLNLISFINYWLALKPIPQELDFSAFEIDAENFAYCMAIYKNVSQEMKILNLNDIQFNNKDIGLILSSLKKQKFNEILLSNNNIDDQAISAIIEFLRSNKSVQEINLFNNKISDVGAEKIFEFLKKEVNNLSIKAINLGWNEIKNQNIQDDINKLLTISHRQKIHRFSKNCITMFFKGSQNVNGIGSYKAPVWIKHATHGKLLNLDNTELDEKQVVELKKFLIQTKNVTEFSMVNDDLYPEYQLDPIAIYSVAEAFKENQTLNVLALSFNYLNDEGMDILLQNFALSQITELYCSFCNLSDFIVKKIVLFMNTNISLKALDLLGNDFTSQGVSFLVEALKDNICITQFIVVDDADDDEIDTKINRILIMQNIDEILKKNLKYAEVMGNLKKLFGSNIDYQNRNVVEDIKNKFNEKFEELKKIYIFSSKAEEQHHLLVAKFLEDKKNLDISKLENEPRKKKVKIEHEEVTSIADALELHNTYFTL